MENNRHIPEWLKNLQENSWELELLISGGAIFSLFQFTDYFLNWFNFIKTISPIPGQNIMLMVVMIAIKILTMGFAIHLSLRAYWLALVCINYVYPNGINTNKIGWKKPFTTNIENKSDLQEYITKVDKNCGTVIFMSIVSVFGIIGLLLSFSVLIFFMVMIVENINIALANYFFTFFVSFFVLYLIDFLTFGLLRRTPILSYIFFPFFKLYDFLSLRSFYQKPLWLFNTNVKKITFSLKTLLFTSVAICLAYLSVYRTMYWPNLFDQREYRWQMADNHYMSTGYYMDEWLDEKIYRIGIDSKKLHTNYMELFVRYDKKYDRFIGLTSETDSLKTFENIIEVNINGKKLNNLKWFPCSKKNHIIGISTMISLNEFKNGNYTLSVSTKEEFQSDIFAHEMGGYIVNIPFWVDKPQPIIVKDTISIK